MQVFHINTRNTSLILAALPSGLLSCLHYGARLRLSLIHIYQLQRG